MRLGFKSALGSLFVALLILLSTIVATAAWAQQPNRVPVLIGFNRQPGPAEETLVRRASGSIKYTYHLVPAIAATLPENAIDALRRNPNVITIEPDGLFHKIDYDTELNNTWGVKRVGAGTVHANGHKGLNVKVAIIDSGIDYDHADLKANYAGGYNFVAKNSNPMDDNGHGTHVAGTVAAIMNGAGVVGVAPEARLYGLKILGSNGSGSFSDAIAALQWAVDNKIQITNNSYGSGGDPGSIVKAAFDTSAAAGIVHVAAAGNSGSPHGKNDSVGYPAKYDSVIAVAATNSSNTRPNWSSTGPAVELSGPGVNITSTKTGGGYVIYSGTSMASPHVAGVAALVLGAGVTDPNEVRQILTSTATDLGTAGRDTHYGYGLVNAVDAVAAAYNFSTTQPSSPGVYVNLSTDSSKYTSGTDLVVVLTVSVRDEANQAIAGLASDSFTTKLNGSGVAASFSQTPTPGTYTGTLSISTLSPGLHTVEVTVTASGVSGSQSTTFSVETASTVSTVGVSAIDYAGSGGKNSDKHLNIKLIVNNDSGAAVSGASVSIDLSRNGVSMGAAAGTTGSDGTVSFTYNNAPTGCYSTTVTAVSAAGLDWDGETPSNSHCK